MSFHLQNLLVRKRKTFETFPKHFMITSLLSGITIIAARYATSVILGHSILIFFVIYFLFYFTFGSPLLTGLLTYGMG